MSNSRSTGRLTVIVNHLFHITHDLSVSTLGNIGLLVDGV
jgi:hypothetical protein